MQTQRKWSRVTHFFRSLQVAEVLVTLHETVIKIHKLGHWNHNTGQCAIARVRKTVKCWRAKIWGFHTLAEKTAVGYHDAFGDHRIYGRNCPSNNRFAQVLSDRDQVEGGSSADHSNAWDSHRVKLRFT